MAYLLKQGFQIRVSHVIRAKAKPLNKTRRDIINQKLMKTVHNFMFQEGKTTMYVQGLT